MNWKKPSAHLDPIPVLGKPLMRLIVNCVGSLPKPKSGRQHILIIMCYPTSYVETILLHLIRACLVVKVLVKFWSSLSVPDRSRVKFHLKRFHTDVVEVGVNA